MRTASTTTTRTTTTSSFWNVLAPLVSLFGLYVFITSFFLAKRSLPHTSTCEEASALLETTLGLSSLETQALRDQHILQGCWMPRKVDSMVMIVIDALRFDFALHHLPRSVGARIQQLGNASSQSRLLQFVADPPTVTMQRLKALTTGGLPTFADISGNMGGASIEEDTWINQIQTTPFATRQLSTKPKIAFVGDDTWLDLFPHSLDEAYPFPSFNTRDLNTVDDGCLHHLPGLLAKLRTHNTANNDNKDEEVLIVHFLGVDHVGHTYGPHNQHMDAKLNQMDTALVELLEKLDTQTEACSVAFIFGDHGMTEDGNHGGGSDEEINAALFAHFSPACNATSVWQQEEYDNIANMRSKDAQTAFTSIHQIDLVPTISILLGLPIPYANLGALVPALSLLTTPSETATALALNAAQVWRYFTQYSKTANQLPGMNELEERLDEAVRVWKEALAAGPSVDSTAAVKASSLFKLFLSEALQLGQRVWTRFDTTGMAIGVGIIFVAIVLWCIPFWDHEAVDATQTLVSLPPPGELWELLLTLLFVVFSCGVLTFGNSYILEEEHVCMFMIGILSFVLSIRLASNTTTSYIHKLAPIVIPVASRLSEMFVTGHGQDPSVVAHGAHHPMMFLSSILLLMISRWYLCHGLQFTLSQSHMKVDLATLLCLGQSWWEKRQPDLERHGFWGARFAIVLVVGSLLVSIYQALSTLNERHNQQYQQSMNKSSNASSTTTMLLSPGDAVTIIIKFLFLIMIVTGPSSATSALFFSAQAVAIFALSGITGPSMIPSAVLAALWRFIIRHVFFATNHGCSFARLQVSSAFVATATFNFAFAGASLFINTFGWEIVGLCIAWLLSSNATVAARATANSPTTRRTSLWRWFCLYQMIETVCSCISVSVLRRHLMVWDIYAPHFLFVAIFMILYAAFQLLVCYFGNYHQPRLSDR